MGRTFKKAISFLLCFAMLFGMGVDCIALTAGTVESDYSAFDSEDTSEYELYSTYSTGKIGNLTWYVYDNGLLEIAGTGAIPTYSASSAAPWSGYSYSINRILVRDTVTQIGSFSFYNLSKVQSVTLPFVGYSRTATGPEATFGHVFGYSKEVAYNSSSGSSEYIYDGTTGSQVGRISYTSSSSYPFKNSLPSGSYSTLGFESGYIPFKKGSTTAFCNFRVGDVPSGTTWQYTTYDYKVGTYNSNTYYAMQSYYYYIPSTLKKVTITDASKISDCAFMNCSNFKEINLNSGITSIGQRAFFENTGLDIFKMPGDLKTLGEYAFYNCDGLTDIELPQGLTAVGRYTFYGCDYLGYVRFGAEITTIDDYAFYSCRQLKDFELPEKLKTIGSYAFAHCSKIGRILIPNDVTTIGDYAFSYCAATSIYFGDSVRTIEAYAFAGENITALYIPDNVTTIRQGAFNGCSKLKEVSLPFVGKSRTAVGPEATFGYVFGYSKQVAYNSSSGSSKYIYDGTTGSQVGRISYTSSSSYPFKNSLPSGSYSTLGFESGYIPFKKGSTTAFCNFRVGDVPSDTTWQYTTYDYYVGAYESNDYYAMQSYYYSIPATITKVTVTDTTEISAGAFMNCTNIKEIHLNTAIDYISYYAFTNCPATVTQEPMDNAYISYPNKYSYTNGKDTFYYSVENGEATITDCSTTSENITLPAEIDGYPVVAVGYKGMAYCTTLKSATIPNSITKLDKYAFYSCTQIDTVTIPATCKYVGSYAFSGCSKLTTVVIAEGVEFIGDNCFENCKALTEIVVPDSCTHLGKYAFYNCTAMETATIGITVPAIEKYTFYNCSKLQSVVIGLAVESIGDYAFYNTALTRVVTYNKLQSIGRYAFASCDALTRVTLRAGLLTIGEGAFKDNILLSTINLPSSITGIGAYAFYNCQSLASVTIPELVTTIDDYTFGHCYALASVKVNGTIKTIGMYAFYRAMLSEYDFKEGLLAIDQGAFEGNKLTAITLPNTLVYLGEQVFSKNAELATVSMPDSVTTVLAYAFGETAPTLAITIRYNKGTVAANMLCNTPVVSVVMEDGITAIGDYSFAYCRNLASITFPETLQSIGSYAFYENRKYSEVTLPKNVVSIGTYAFGRGYALNKIIIPDSVQTIGASAFYRTSDKDISPDVTVVVYYNGGAICANLLNGQHMNHIIVNDNIYSLGNNAFSKAWNLETVSLPDTISACGTDCFAGSSTALYIRCVDGLVDDSVYREKLSSVYYLETTDTDIGDYAFYGNTQSYDLKITDGLIGDYAFAENKNLNTAEIIGETDIGQYAFSNDAKLSKVTITGQTNIGDYAFSNDVGLLTTTITGQTDVGNYAFFNCNAMKNFTIDGTMETIGQHAFDSCKSMGGVILPDTVNYIGAYAFYDCNSMDSINIPEGVEKLLSHTFYGCASLKQIVVPNSVTAIEDYVFYGCVKVASITLSDQCVSIGDCAFYNCKSLQALVIPNSVKTIGEYAFRSCVAIEELVFSDNIEEIGVCAFYDCNGMKTIMFGKNVVELNDRLFYGCVNLQDITLHGDVSYIHDLAFYGAEATVVYAFENEYVETYCNDMGLEYYNLNRDFTMVFTAPTKTEYMEYDQLDMTGIVLELTYTNGLERTITTGYTVSGYDPMKLGTQTITVTYNGQSVTYDVNVTAKSASSVKVVAGAPSEIIVGEELDCSKMVVLVTFTDGTSVELCEGYTVTGYQAQKIGEQTITVTYRQASMDLRLNVKDYVRGDINNDGLITMKDVTRLVNYLNDSTVSVIDSSLDVNGDGVVTIKDVTRLVEYLEDNTVQIF